MKVILKNSTLTFVKGLWTATGRIIKVLSSEATSVAFPVGKSCNVMGRNLVDLAHLKYHKILNDSGVEVDDSSSYFDNFIPMLGGGAIRSNAGISKIYYYDQNKSLINININIKLVKSKQKVLHEHSSIDVNSFADRGVK